MSRPPLSTRFRRALVTGASGGLGRAFAEMLRAEGVEVWGTSRRADALPAAARFHAVAFDLAAGGAAAEAWFAQLDAAAGGFDLVVHNAGYGVFGALDAVPRERWQAQLDEMLGVSLALNRAAFAAFRARGRGAIVNVSSLAAEFPIPFMSGYNVAKAGLSALSESLMLEAAGTGITVLDFRPGNYRTGFNSSMSTLSPLPLTGPASRVWALLEHHLSRGPAAERAAADLRRALRRGRGGVVRSGNFFEAAVAPFFARFLPRAWQQAVNARYYRLR